MILSNNSISYVLFIDSAVLCKCANHKTFFVLNKVVLLFSLVS